MNLADQVVSLPYANKLKELKFEYYSLFYWVPDLPTIYPPNPNYEKRKYLLRSKPFIVMNPDDAISAFTVAELGEILTTQLENYDLQISPMRGLDNNISKKYWVIRYISQYECSDEILHCEHSFNEADALAKMLIYLIENQLIKVT